MKNIVFIFLALSFSPLCLANLYSNQPVPVQSYHDASVFKASTNKSSGASQMAKVQAIMAKAHEQVQHADANPAADSNAEPPATVNQADPTRGQAQSPQELGAQLNLINQMNLQFQQRVNQRLEALTTKNNELEQRVEKLVEALTVLNQEIKRLGASQEMTGVEAHIKQQTQNITGFFDRHSTYLWIYALLAMMVFLMLFIVGLMRKLIKQRQQLIVAGASSASTDDDTKSEYDFLNTEEAIPAKLDLARAYLAMDDLSSAKKILTQVLEHGDAAQQQEAKDLLAQAVQEK